VTIEGFLLRHPVGWERLSRAVADLYGVAVEAVGRLEIGVEMDSSPCLILLETHQHREGFRLDVTVYASIVTTVTQRGIPLASQIATALGEDVLTSPPASGHHPPWRWVLATPAGQLMLVDEMAYEHDGIIIDPTVAIPYTYDVI
jgi:hypothetical protein